MKRLIIPVVGLSCLLVLVNGCAKKTISGDSANLQIGAYVTLDSVVNGILDVGNANATVSIMIGKSVGSPVASINIYAATGSNPEDSTGWKFIKTVTYSAGVVLSVSTAELAKALGSAPAPGNSYVLENQIVTTDGRRYGANNTPDTYSTFPAYNMALKWTATAVCAFTGHMAGDYYITKDDWQDYYGTVTLPYLITGAIKDGPGANQISIWVYPGAPVNGVETAPMIVDVDPKTGAAKIENGDLGNYGSAASDLTVTGGSGFVFDCAGVVDLKINFFYYGGPANGNQMTLKKTP